MAGITKTQAETILTEYRAALSAVLLGQSYSIAGRTVTKANLAEIERGVRGWDATVKRLNRGGMKVRYVTPES